MANRHWIDQKPMNVPFSRQFSNWHLGRFFIWIPGILAAMLVLGLFLFKNSYHSKIQYGPADISGQQPIRAVHGFGGGSPSPSTAKLDSQSPLLVISESFYDFGSVKTPQVANRVFIIANQGQSPLLIQKAYTTCGCTTADFSASIIPPGKVALMTVHFDSGFHDLRGTTVRRGIIFLTNDPAHPQVEIWVQASVN